MLTIQCDISARQLPDNPGVSIIQTSCNYTGAGSQSDFLIFNAIQSLLAKVNGQSENDVIMILQNELGLQLNPPDPSHVDRFPPPQEL